MYIHCLITYVLLVVMHMQQFDSFGESFISIYILSTSAKYVACLQYCPHQYIQYCMCVQYFWYLRIYIHKYISMYIEQTQGQLYIYQTHIGIILTRDFYVAKQLCSYVCVVSIIATIDTTRHHGTTKVSKLSIPRILVL